MRFPLLFLLALILTACGKVGDPQPPFIRIPESAADFGVEQVAYELRFRWTNPSRNLDQSSADDLERALIRADDEVIAELDVVGPGDPQSFVLPARNLVGVSRPYSVFFGTAGGRFSDPSPAVSLTVVEVPGAGAPPRSSVDQGRVRIEWGPPGENPGLADAYRVYRSGAPIVPETRESGIADASFVEGESYQYAVVPLRRLGDRTVEGVPYPAIVVVARDDVPPAPPRGLDIVSFDGGAYVQWRESPESDVARYRVYRRTGGNAEFVAVAGGDRTVTAYPDLEYRPGFEYAVSAIDESGNESALSEIVSER